MSIGGLEFEKKLFEIRKSSEKTFLGEISGPRVREAYAWSRNEENVFINKAWAPGPL